MNIRKENIITGKSNVMNIPVTIKQINAWQGGELIQNAMPNLSSTQREFLMTGMTADEQEGVFKSMENHYEMANA